MFGDIGKVILEIWRHGFALRNLIMKDFRIRYRNMALGVVWSVINPLVMLGILLVVFTFIYPQRGHVFFPISVLLGLVSFNILALCIPAATTCIVDNSPLVKKVIFPRQILPISVILSQSIQSLTQLGLAAVFILVFRVPVTAKFLLAPLILAVLLIYVIGVGLICAAINVIFRDAQYIVESSLTVGFWMSPIFYTLPIVHGAFPKWLFGLYLLNPLAGCIDALRRVILENKYPDLLSLGVATAVAFGALLAGFTIFGRLQKQFADLV